MAENFDTTVIASEDHVGTVRELTLAELSIVSGGDAAATWQMGGSGCGMNSWGQVVNPFNCLRR